MTAHLPTVELPRYLQAGDPGWSTSADVIVVGSGIAGLTCALRLRERVGRVLLVTKTVLSAGSTQWAQGGIAAALDPEDSPQEHLDDTLIAGVGLCDADAVRALVTEGPVRVRELVALGAEFDRAPGGDILLTREGGHHRDRIAHAGGDATGAEISRALIAALDRVKNDPEIEVIEHALVVDLLTDAEGRVCGVTLHVIGEGQQGGVGSAYARLTDLEFVQFHPTVMYLGEGAIGQQPLISEAVRGEGAFLVDDTGERFMQGRHPQADLAPRDVVARAIVARMRESGAEHVWLDARHLSADFLERRFPSIVARCRELGCDPATQLIPVAPAQHYASGGIWSDLHGRSSIPGLYACGETACTGVHGANRLASNSLLEGLVFARRIADDIADRFAGGDLMAAVPVEPDDDRGLLAADRRRAVQRAMTSGSGVVRSAAATEETHAALRALLAEPSSAQPTTQAWETTNLAHLGLALTAAAHARAETRGGHERLDFPERDDDSWLGHLHHVRSGRELTMSYVHQEDSGR